MEAMLHIDVMSLSWSIWANPQAKVYAIVQYLLTTADDKSLTWSVHLRLIFRKYNLLDPLTLLQSNVWPKTKWKTYSKTLITASHEKQLKEKARSNINLKYFNVTVSGLSDHIGNKLGLS